MTQPDLSPHPCFSLGTSVARVLMSGVLALMLHHRAVSQELNCNVTVIAPQISNVDASRFDALEDAIREFLTGRRWTEDH